MVYYPFIFAAFNWLKFLNVANFIFTKVITWEFFLLSVS